MKISLHYHLLSRSLLSMTAVFLCMGVANTAHAVAIVDLEPVENGGWLEEDPFVPSGGGNVDGWGYQNLAEGTIQSTDAGNPIVQSGTVSVAYAQNRTDGDVSYTLEVQDRPNDSVLQLGASTNGTYDLNRGILLWDKSDFLGGGDGAQVDITADNAFSASFEALRGSNNRWVVEIGGQLYGSVETFSSGSGSKTSSGITSTQWQPFTIGTLTDTIDTNWADLGTAQNLTLENITAVGLYLDGGERNNNVTSFSVEGTVVPEPSASALLLGALGLGLLLIRRHHS